MKLLTLHDIETRVSETVTIARLSGMTDKEMNERLIEWIVRPIASRTAKGRLRHSIWMQGYAAGVIAQASNSVWKEVEFCYRNKDGVIYSTAKHSTHFNTEDFYSVGNGYMLADMECAHVWKGTDKPYTAWSYSSGVKA